MMTIPDEFCVQCGRKLGAMRWHLAAGKPGTKHGPFCTPRCTELSQEPPANPFAGLSTGATP